MTRISLIANSSIQYYKFSTNIDLEFGKQNRLSFHQPFDTNILNFIYDPVFLVKMDGENVYFKKQELLEKAYLVNGRLKDDVDLSDCERISDDKIEQISNLKSALKKFQKKWIPLPYFKDNRINKDLTYPTDWVRVYFECNEEFTSAEVVMAFDTSLAKSENDQSGPQLSLNPDENIYLLNSEEYLISRFLIDQEASSKWMEKYIADVFYGKNEEARFEQPIKKYVGFYLLLLKWIDSLKDTPEIQLFTENTRKIPVDLVIDIGNSSTCALLFENPQDSGFNFNRVKRLKIQDYTFPQKEYQNSFPMNLVFKEAKFGNINQDNYHNDKFMVPSLVRIGFEANNLINSMSTNLDLGRELRSFNSSPKRYLWDDKPAENEWEYVPDQNRQAKKIYLNGISEQLKIDGSLVQKGDVFGSRALYSRSSLMKFVFLEMLIHAYVQINSYEFRKEHGNLTTPRTLKRITISCPTAMIKHEQIALRKAAEDASKLLNNYFEIYYGGEADAGYWFEIPEIIPSIKDLEKNLEQLEERKDWSYDEATSSQLVFLYGLLSKKLKGNQFAISNFLYKNKQRLRVGSVDIGAGTTDLMIADYKLNQDSNIVELRPNPVYYDSFKLAGDDMLKELVHQIVIQAKINSEEDRGNTGVIQNYGIEQGMTDMVEKINGFFGPDSNLIGFEGKIMRKAFIHQVAIPIVLYYLDNTNSNENETKTFEEILGNSYENKELIKYFENHFGFNFLEIKWNISPKKVETIVDAFFDGMVKQLSLILNHYKCDFVVLSGKPNDLHCMENLFLKYLSVSKDRMVNLNNYWIGHWFPFADDRGFVKDAKTMVTVGAMISLMSNRLNKLEDLRLDITDIKQKLVSTADFIVKKEFDSKKVLLSPKKEEGILVAEHLPYHFGYSKIMAKEYPVSDLYSISLDLDELRNRFNNDEDRINKKRAEIEQNFPLKISLVREYDISKESLKIEDVEDADGNEHSGKIFKLNYQTLGDQQEYWLDSCEFILGI